MTNSSERAAGKVVLVTGGARGMGESHCRTLISAGATVVITDVLDDEGMALANALGPRSTYLRLDVSDPDSWDAIIEQSCKQFGTVDALINNAGIAIGHDLVDYPTEMWRKTIDINLSGAFYGMRAVAPVMIAAGRGSIVNISSVEGMRGSPMSIGYSASKFGLRGLTQSGAIQLGQSGVRVNSIHPGHIATPMTKEFPASSLRIPLARGASPVEVSQAVLFLTSDESSYVNGAEIVVDGGLISGFPLS